MAIDWGVITGVAGMVTGVGGLVLGIANRRHAQQQTATRLRVEPFLTDGHDAKGLKQFLVRVVNDSTFPVRVDSVGLVLREGDDFLQTVALVYLDIDRSNRRRPEGLSLDAPTPGDLPIDVAARASIVLRPELVDMIAVHLMPLDHAFAVTATGKPFKSKRRGPLVGKTLVQMRAIAIN